MLPGPIPPIDAIATRLEADGSVHLRGVVPGARPWLAAALASSLNRERSAPLVWVLPDERQAEAALAAARFYAGADRADPSDPFAQPVAAFPLHQLSPYDDLSPDRDAMATRLGLLFRLLQGPAPALLITSVPALMRKVPPRAVMDAASELVVVGQEMEQARLARWLDRAGYLNVPLVEEAGGYAVRGFVMDIFTPLLPLPVRLEWFGDEIESIRTFDPETQRTATRLDAAYLGPVREILQDEDSTARALSAVDALAAELDVASHKLLAHSRKLREGIRYFGMEALLPAFHPNLECLFDYLPAGFKFLLDDPGGLSEAAHKGWERVAAAHGDARSAGDLVFEPQCLLLEPDDLVERLRAAPGASVGIAEQTEEVIDLACQETTPLREEIRQASSGDDPLAPLTEALKTWRRDGMTCTLVAARVGRARQLVRMVQSRGLAVRDEQSSFDLGWPAQATPNLFARIAYGRLELGFACPSAGIAVLPDEIIFGRPAQRARDPKPSREVLRLEPGELIVHMDFGIGKFEGLVKLEAGGSEADFLLLTYRAGDKLYLPVTRMNRIERYTGPEKTAPPLTKLGGKSWERTKQRVHQALLEMADELVRVEALRRAQPGLAVEAPGEEYQALEASFPFEETPDQRRAIQEVTTDLSAPRAMDRLICGDVGFGKTEVAIRAATLTALSGRQTLVLVPTTILALQHLATFRSRLGDFSMRVGMLSRLATKDEQRQVLAELASGQMDLVVGTHRLLAHDVKPKSLGLLIIDEEHRFGVRHKEKLKRLKAEVDVLTMTATPLPRTLQLALNGLRDISVIRTPPSGRRATRTFITRFSPRVIEEAIRRERARGGQVFFVHNFVRSLEGMKRFLERTVPEVRVGLAHGQMHERKLEQVMTAFVQRDLDVLLSTSIIESGLDIPSANTVIVNRADRFGLAQLYQIRGRVGRAAERAYAYFLIPGVDSITKDARLRLEALADHTELGAGYQIASRDLEIRGAGNLLGKAQSGHIKAIGFELYNRLLERAVMEVRGQATQTGPDPEIKLPLPGYLPEDYVPELDQRLDLYARLSRAEDEDEVLDLEQEIGDRYGPPTPEVQNLIELSALKTHLRRAGVLSLTVRGGALSLAFDTQAAGFDPGPLVKLVSEQSERARLDPAGCLEIQLDTEERADPLPLARSLGARLAALMA